MIVDEKMFLQLLTKELGLYSVFNGLRDALFYQLASQSRTPVSNNELDHVLAEAEELTRDQINLVKKEIPKPDGFRHYVCDFENIRIHYFVNVSHKDYLIIGEDAVAKHMQEIQPNIWSSEENCDEDEREDVFVSVIILHENHPDRTDANYPMIIKHELVHAAMEYLIDGDIDLMRFCFDDKNHKFIEFLCDVVPYLSNYVKKDSGLNKYMDDAKVLFGYDAGEVMGNYIHMIRDMDDDHNPFKNNAEKYAFFLLETDGKTRMKLLGVNKMMYTSSNVAKRWKESIEAGLSEGELEENRKGNALAVLSELYGRMTE